MHLSQRYDSSHIWKPLTKRKRRHLELSSQLLWSSYRYFVAKSDVCSTEYPDQMLLDEKYEEKCRGEDLYRGDIRPETGWVEGREILGSKFDQKQG